MGKCYDTNHDYRPATEVQYFKLDGETNDYGSLSRDESVAFRILYCAKCGDTKEIIAADYRQKSET